VKAMTPNNEKSGEFENNVEVGFWHNLQTKVACHSTMTLEDWFEARFEELENKFASYVTSNSTKLRISRHKESE
jgi:hypothetical protein